MTATKKERNGRSAVDLASYEEREREVKRKKQEYKKRKRTIAQQLNEVRSQPPLRKRMPGKLAGLDELLRTYGQSSPTHSYDSATGHAAYSMPQPGPLHHQGAGDAYGSVPVEDQSYGSDEDSDNRHDDVSETSDSEESFDDSADDFASNDENDSDDTSDIDLVAAASAALADNPANAALVAMMQQMQQQLNSLQKQKARRLGKKKNASKKTVATVSPASSSSSSKKAKKTAGPDVAYVGSPSAAAAMQSSRDMKKKKAKNSSRSKPTTPTDANVIPRKKEAPSSSSRGSRSAKPKEKMTARNSKDIRGVPQQPREKSSSSVSHRRDDSRDDYLPTADSDTEEFDFDAYASGRAENPVSEFVTRYIDDDDFDEMASPSYACATSYDPAVSRERKYDKQETVERQAKKEPKEKMTSSRKGGRSGTLSVAEKQKKREQERKKREYARKKKEAEQRKETEELRKCVSNVTVDVCIMLDCTGSMSGVLAEAKKRIKELKDELLGMELTPRFAFVGYRDFGDEGAIVTQNFVPAREWATVQAVIAAQKANGGGDIPEDISGAFHAASQLSWASKFKLIVHIADAPCHGTKYHDFKDDHPNCERDPTAQLTGLARSGIDYTFLKMTTSTEKMLEFFATAYNNTSRIFRTSNLNDPADFLSEVVESVRESTSSSDSLMAANTFDLDGGV
eukprot:CAMPEP_0114603848 /NCGR_PEP_ID=MMETSP0168-20121206/242_1 /TAXON_ID=95228 ORGANISM="Vannella sp., Strain DIVA3 517/6/12" /NCGR_SAMPLE_ID=MMETSP0168 /ASSEMBLY_ACC=CAM_ASM_000044 /LENGTH=681 /DNA_ID=CAMNT_0001814663 /DNA_START=32 /DNA_END=2077 /DNA_ORIENTATION=-